MWTTLGALTYVTGNAKMYHSPAMVLVSLVMNLTVIPNVTISLLQFINVGLNVRHLTFLAIRAVTQALVMTVKKIGV